MHNPPPPKKSDTIYGKLKLLVCSTDMSFNISAKRHFSAHKANLGSTANSITLNLQKLYG